MATLEENINQAIADFDDIKSAIEEQGVEVPYGTDTNEYGNKIRSIKTGVETDQTYNPESSNAQSGIAVAEALAGLPIKTVESPDADGNYLNLYDLESGMYILNGRFYVYPNATKRFVFNRSLFVAVSHGSISTCVQVIYPPYNTIQYLNIYPPDEEAGTDYTYERKDAELYYMEDVRQKVTEINGLSDDEHYPSAKAVYDAVNGNTLHGKASGEVIRVDDVNPIEHTVKAKVKSKNLWDMSKITSTANVTNNGDGSLTIAPNTYYGTTSKRLYEVCPQLKVGDVVTLSMLSDGVQYIYLSIYGTTVWNGDTITVTEDILNSVIAVYGVADTDEGYANAHTISYIQLEYGDTATEYEPYVDPSTVTVTRCGKNLIPFPYPLLLNEKTQSGLTITPQDDGAIVLDGTATADAYINLAKFRLCSKSIYPWSTHGMISNGIQNNAIRCVYDYSNHLTFILVPNGTVCENVKFYPQIEVGTVISDFEKGNPMETHTPSADGTVNGITSLSPTMTLLTDKAGVTIEAEYNQDTNKAMQNVNTDIAELDRVTAELVGNMGDIETALDSIIAVQESLIGGGD